MWSAPVPKGVASPDSKQGTITHIQRHNDWAAFVRRYSPLHATRHGQQIIIYQVLAGGVRREREMNCKREKPKSKATIDEGWKMTCKRS